MTLDQHFASLRGRLRTISTTGTNGKTTTTSMVAAIVRASGEVDARVTTVGSWVAGERIPASEPMQEFLGAAERAVELGARTLALEVTSKALAGGHATGWPPDVAVFTNLSRDHLDMHGSPEAYLAAKAQLFLALTPGRTAVLFGDDPASELLREVIRPGVLIRRFSLVDPSADLAATSVEVRPGKTRIELAPSALGRALGGELELGVTGGVHARNALAAALACDALGYPAAAVRQGLQTFTGVPGRFELLAERPLVVVDYAHTPDGLLGTLTTARELAEGRVVCVFGCGGERDHGKRPEMGAVADRLADVVVLTTDNPRHERPEDIASHVRAGAPSPLATWLEEPDRAEAIRLALQLASPGDVVVIAGKGHEAVQEVGDEALPFLDAEVARRALDARSTPGRPDRRTPGEAVRPEAAPRRSR